MKITIEEEGIQIEGEGNNADIADLISQGVDQISQELFKSGDEIAFAYLLDNLRMLVKIGEKIAEKEFDAETKEKINKMKEAYKVEEEQIEKRIEPIIKNLKEERNKNDQSEIKQAN